MTTWLSAAHRTRGRNQSVNSLLVTKVAGGDEGRARWHQENEGEHSGELQESLLAHSWAATVFMPKGVMKAAPEQLRHHSVHEGPEVSQG